MAITSPGDVTNLKVGNHRVTWNGVVMGHTAAGSTITIEKIFRESTVDAFGQTVVKKFLIGEKVSVELVLKEFTPVIFGKTLPGSTTTSTTTVEDGVQYAGAVELSALAQGLILHPLTLDDSVLSGDWNIWKTVPVINGGIPLKSDGFSLSYPVGQLFVILVLTALAGVLAAVYPARKASKLDVLEAVSYE